MWDVGNCDVCMHRAKTTTSSLPGLPVTVARCLRCLEADAIPLWMAVIQTVEIGGMENAADWWRECVADTLEFLSIPAPEFYRMVEAQLSEDGAMQA